MISTVIASVGTACILGSYGLFVQNTYNKTKPKSNLKEAIKGAKEGITQRDEFEQIFKELDIVTENKNGEIEIPYIERKLISDYYNIYILHTPTKIYLEDIEKCKEDLQKKLKTKVYINRDEETATIFISEKHKIEK